MNYSKSPSAALAGSPHGKQLSDGPIRDLATVIEKTTPEDWIKRTQALASLVATIPSGSEYVSAEAWYNTPTVLRHLAWPLVELLKDLRSTVVIKTCESCAELFAKCQMDARYLLKDLMPTVLSLHAQTVHIIRQSVQDMVVDAMAVTPCKMVMPIWLDRLKSDKSRTVREGCAMYLGVALNEWTEPGYLSLQIWEQVGTALTKALRDPAPTVRQQSKKGLEIINRVQPDVFDRLLENSDLLRDVRVRKTLERIQAGENIADDVSVTSYGSRGGGSVASSRRRGVGGGGGGGASSSVTGSRGKLTSRSGIDSRPKPGPIPMTIGVTTKWNPSPREGRTGTLGPPLRMPAPFQAAIESPPKTERRAEVPRRPVVPVNGTPSPPTPMTTRAVTDDIPDIQASNTSFETTDTNESDLPVIATVDELREFAKTQGDSRRSSTLQERFARSGTHSSSNLEDIKETNEESGIIEIGNTDVGNELLKETTKEKTNNVPPTEVVATSEHIQIAWALLEAHKKHVDIIMETLKVEMDALKEFEMVMLNKDPLRPTEDEVLEYFESVGLCVAQRAKAGTILQKKMDKISSGTL
jgi:hypothetical protein